MSHEARLLLDYATLEPLDLKKLHEIQRDLMAIAGSLQAEFDRLNRLLGEREVAWAKRGSILLECEEYFDQRADADQPPGASYPIGNEEMCLLGEIRRNLNIPPRTIG